MANSACGTVGRRLFAGMRKCLFLVGLLVSGGLLAVARAEAWSTVQGDRWEGALSGVYGPLAIFTEKAATRQVSVELLDDASLGRVADFLAAQTAGATPWSSAGSKMARALRGRLQVLRDQKLVAFNPGARPEPEIYLAYFGALWCGPCRRFSPELVQAYHQLKAAAGDQFELVFMSSDRDGGEQLSYVREVAMPWPVLKFSAVGSTPLIEQWAGRGIPSLVALTREGEVIFHSYRGSEYLGPQHVLAQFAQLVLARKGESASVKRALHRLAVLQHVRAAAGRDAGVRPYLISLDPARYQTLEVKQLTATLELDAHGRVSDASFEPKQAVVVDFQLVQDAASWLFLPAVEQGVAKARRVTLPLQL